MDKQNDKPFGTGEMPEYTQRFKNGSWLVIYLAY